jgi:hypothetical protein
MTGTESSGLPSKMGLTEPVADVQRILLAPVQCTVLLPGNLLFSCANLGQCARHINDLSMLG